MGGEGSGRPTKEMQLVRTLAPKQTPIGFTGVTNDGEFFLPNHSGEHKKGIVRDTPSNDLDLTNKKYVDDAISAALASYYKLDQTTPQNIVPYTGTTMSLSYKDIVGVGLGIFPKLKFTNSNSVGAPTKVGLLDYGLFIQNDDDDLPTAGFIGSDVSTKPYGVIQYDASGDGSFNILTDVSNEGDCKIILKQFDTGSDTFPVIEGAYSGGKLLLFDTNIGLWDSTGAGSVTFFAVNEDGTKTSVVFNWDSTTETFLYSGAGGMTISTQSSGDASVETALKLISESLGDGAVGDGERIQFGLRNSEGLLGQAYDAGYIEVVATDITDGSEDAYMSLGTITAGSETELLKLSGNEIIFNESGLDCDFRVESDSDTNCFFINGGTNTVGIGAQTHNAKLHLNQGNFSTTTDWANFYCTGTKTGGASDYNDRLWGRRVDIGFNQSGGEIGHMYGQQDTITHTAGTIGAAGNARDLTGLYTFLDLNGGTVTNNTFGARLTIDQESSHTISGATYGLYIEMDLDGTTTGATYGLYIKEYSGIDYGIYQSGTAPNVLGGDLTVGDVDIGSGDAFYLGGKTTSGSWRIVRSGNDLVIQRYEGDPLAWVTKSTISA